MNDANPKQVEQMLPQNPQNSPIDLESVSLIPPLQKEWGTLVIGFI